MNKDRQDHYTVLKKIESSEISSQRNLARETGFSLGKVNYLLNALLEKGFVKLGNFCKSNNKLGYRYLLTPSGAGEKTRLARVFLKRKTNEYELLRQEIEELKQEVHGSLQDSEA